MEAPYLGFLRQLQALEVLAHRARRIAVVDEQHRRLLSATGLSCELAAEDAER